MMEIYDAPMLEPDVDVPMHATFGSSPKTWNEATMDDDTYETADVEVDMEGYGDGVEYEMEDENSGYEEQAVPVVDVEFVDAHVDDASPADAVVAEPVLEHDMTEHPPEYSEAAVVEAASTFEAIDSAAEASFVTAFEGDITVSEPSAPEPAPPPENYEAPTIENAPEDGPNDSQPEPFDAPSEAHPEYLAERPEEAVDGPYEEAAGGVYDESAGTPYEESGEGHDGGAETAYDAEHGPYDEAQGDPYAEEPPQEESGEAYGASPEGEANVYREPEGSLEQEHEGDPHEIEDGMFIEPPPAVLLDLSTSSDEAFYCLFNEPSSSRAGSSAGEPSTPPRYLVLLEEQPTLYYAPLSEVFSELRSVGDVQRLMPDYAEGEMMLDAYDLQLVVSEDNVLASEVSLHDLNSLHDGNGHDGPLRLRLRCSPFRFLTRYYALREQVYRLDLAEADTAYDVDETPAGEQHDQDGPDDQFVSLAPAAETYVQEQAESDAQQDFESGAALQDGWTAAHAAVPAMVHQTLAQEEGEEGQYDDADADAEGEDDEGQDQPTSTTQEEADAAVHEGIGEDAHALEMTYDGPYNDPVDPPSDLQGELDADEVHAQADTDANTGLAPETTEYAEETVPQEEDEEEGDETEEAAAEALDASAPVDEAEEVYEGGEASEGTGTLEGDSVQGGSDDAYAEGEDEQSNEDGYPDDEGAEAGEQDEDEQSRTDPAADNEETSAVFSSLALPTIANGGESQLSGLSAHASDYWDEGSYEGETIAPAVSDGSLKRRYDDLEEYDETEELNTSRQLSVTPDSKRARVE